MSLVPGDRVIWFHKPHWTNCGTLPVPAVVLRQGGKRVLIRAAFELTDGNWKLVERWVAPHNLSWPREVHVPALDEED